jgi:hypothetical protein
MSYFVTISDDIKNKAQARDYAQKWQVWSSEQNLSYGELAFWSDYFTELGRKYNLTDEFKDNGII